MLKVYWDTSLPLPVLVSLFCFPDEKKFQQQEQFMRALQNAEHCKVNTKRQCLQFFSNLLIKCLIQTSFRSKS